MLAVLLSVSLASAVPPIQFPAAPGWNAGTGAARSCGTPTKRCSESWAWTSTVKWRDCRECLPHKTLAILPRDGIIVTVTRVHQRPIFAKRVIAWPPRINPDRVTAGLEGVPARFGVYQSYARLRYGDEINVWAFFGCSKPSASQIAAANARLSKLKRF